MCEEQARSPFPQQPVAHSFGCQSHHPLATQAQLDPRGLCKPVHPLGSYAAGSAKWSWLITPPKTSVIILESYSRTLRAERYDKHLGRAALAVEGNVRARGSGWGQGNGRNVEDQM